MVWLYDRSFTVFGNSRDPLFYDQIQGMMSFGTVVIVIHKVCVVFCYKKYNRIKYHILLRKSLGQRGERLHDYEI